MFGEQATAAGHELPVDRGNGWGADAKKQLGVPPITLNAVQGRGCTEGFPQRPGMCSTAATAYQPGPMKGLPNMQMRAKHTKHAWPLQYKSACDSTQ
jgi:hypothetical protein|mmetsp:Transcript_16464/g.28830  ORF Transcript_16464/g.28830 Transcript_16464/m.28830 type:complete len:97 (+) Transcript_16464:334-624(+)